MSKSDRAGQVSSGPDRQYRTAPRHAYLGVDGEGYHHHADRDARLVYRFDADGRVERTTPLRGGDDTALEAYIHDHVADAVGWVHRPYVTTRDLYGGR